MRRREKNKRGIIVCVAVIAVAACSLKVIKEIKKEKPEDLIVEYMNHIEKQEYAAMYSMVDIDSSLDIGKEKFIERNSRIYGGMEVTNLKISNIVKEERKRETVSVSYDTMFDTVAGKVQFKNKATFTDTKDGYKILWNDSLIFPDLTKKDKVRIITSQAERGEISDRNGRMLAGKGLASSVGIVPGKLENKQETLKILADLLEVDIKTIENKLQAEWVKDDSFVPIATIPKVQELDLMALDVKDSVLKESERQQQLLEIPGVLLSDIEIRSYNLENAASHLMGYVQSVTAEDIENHPGEGYSSNSVIGRSGMEGLFEKELKGRDGYDISIIDENGTTKEVITSVWKEDGKDIQLTIDSELQKALYEQFKDDKGCSVAMNPYTGEVLALVSTPAFDNNDFIKGMSSEKWDSLNEDENTPLYNRFRQVWCPGSTFKPVVAGIGIKTGRLNPNEDFGNEGLAWQKDASWGSYQVTTLHAYEPVVMKNAIIYSDNIYFAKAALKIGADKFMDSLDGLGFNQELPFEIKMSKSQYTNSDKIGTEIQLADSGYGQGQILVNPLHLASIYTAFLNDGNIIKPYLRYQEDAKGKIWIPDAFTKEGVTEIMEGLKGVINDPNGTGYAAHREDKILAGKTGTAELKAAKEDTTGTEIGWFSVFTTDKNEKTPIMIISMVENVKGIGGSGYVVKKDKAVLDDYFGI